MRTLLGTLILLASAALYGVDVVAGEELQAELSYFKSHSSFHEPLYLRLSIKNLSHSEVVIPEPLSDREYRVEYQTDDQDLQHLTFREIRPFGGFEGTKSSVYRLGPMQQLNTYFLRSLPRHLEKNEYYWTNASKGSRLNISMTYFPRASNPSDAADLPKAISDSVSQVIEADVQQDEWIFDFLGKSFDEQGVPLKLLGFRKARISLSRLKSIRNQFQVAECNSIVDLLIRLQRVHEAVGSEQIEADNELASFLNKLDDIKRQALTQYVLLHLPKRCEDLSRDLQQQIDSDRIRPVESIE